MERLRLAGWRGDARSIYQASTLSALAAGLVPLLPADDQAAVLPALPSAQLALLAEAVPGGAANIQDAYPLAPLQEGLLFHHLLKPRGDAYVSPVLVAVDGRDRLDTWIAAFQQMVDRHDILRTAFFWEGLPSPLQVVLKQATLPVEEFQLDPSRDLRAQLDEEMATRHLHVDVRRAPLLRLRIARDPRSARWFVVVLQHHLTSDHVSLQILREEVLACLQGRGHALPAPVPYRGFVAHALARRGEAEAEAFFRNRLADVDEPTLMFGLGDVQGDGRRVRRSRRALPAALHDQVRAAARRMGVPPAALFHLAWALVVGRTSGRDDVVFGSVLSGRLQGAARADRAVGLFINTLPLRVRLNGVTTAAALKGMRDELGQLLRFEQAPLALAQRCSGLAGGSPLFSALFNYRHGSGDAEGATVEGVELLEVREQTSYPVTLSVDDTGTGFMLGAQTDVMVDAGRVIAYLETALQALVQQLATAPDAPLAAIDVLPADERELLLRGFNGPLEAMPGEALVHRLFEAQAARHPEGIALMVGERRISYRALNAMANRLALRLRQAGVAPDGFVALCADRSAELIVGLLATLKAGGAYLPMDPAYPAERLSYMLADARPPVLLTQAHLRDRLPPTEARVIAIDTADEGADPGNPDPAAIGLHARHLAYVIYTSGSTGVPKGVISPHSAAVNRLQAQRQIAAFRPGDVACQKTAIGFVDSVYETLGPLVHGCPLVIAPELVAKDPQALVSLIERERVSRLIAVPSLARALLDLPRIGERLRRLHSWTLGGETLTPQLLRELRATLPGCDFINIYGCSEASADSTWHVGREHEGTHVSMGFPLINTQLYVLDHRSRPAPLGAVGEIFIGGAGVTCGYLNRPDMTAERFLPHPFGAAADARVYKTGDLGRWGEDGRLEYLGRADHQIKIRGNRIEPGEIEARLALHPRVGRVAVVPRDDLAVGERRLAAYVVPRGGEALDVDDLRRHLRAALPEFMMPAAFVVLEALPLTPSGKLDRMQLPVPAAGQALRGRHEPPQGAVEAQLAQLWQELLGVEQVGRHDSFFDLGGHSLVAVRLMSRLQALGLGVSLSLLMSRPTVKGLADAVLSGQCGRADEGAVPLRTGGEGRPLFLAHEVSGEALPYLELSRLLDGGHPVHGLQTLDLDALGEPVSMEALAARHVNTIRRLQPQGPYRLAGWSFGGMLACAIADQLLGQGEAVEFLGLIDTHLSAPGLRTPRTVDEVRLLMTYLRGVLPDVPDGEQQALAALGDVGAILQRCRQAGHLPAELQEAEVRSRLATLGRLIAAGERYRPPAQLPPLHLFSAGHEDPSCGWAEFARGRLAVQVIGGDHWTIMQRPHVQKLAQALSQALARTGAVHRSGHAAVQA
ncbi:hypothetical protein ASC87_27485 [Rhizobacter sp. Root1221]|nr:hypothetical protein ASC87_27485 [Rhizobacter sp. Root1221]